MIPPTIVIATCLLGTLAALAQKTSETKPASQNAWEWVFEAKKDKKTPEEVMTYFREHSGEFETLPEEMPERADDVGFFLAACAYRVRDSRFDELFRKAKDLVERSVQKRDMFSNTALHCHHDLLRHMVEQSEFEKALALADWAQRVRGGYYANPAPADTMSSPYDPGEGMALRALYRSVGDYETVERLLRDALDMQTRQAEKMKAQFKKAGIKNMDSMADVLPAIIRPELAEVLARQGKAGEALAILDAVEKSGGTLAGMKNSGPGKIVHQFLGDGMAARDGLIFAEVALANDQPDRALKLLEVVQEKQKQFVSRFTAAKSSYTNPLIEYEKVAAAKTSDLKARCFWRLGRIDDALRVQEQGLVFLVHLPPSHPDAISARISRAWGWLASGKAVEAGDEAVKIARDQTLSVEELLRFGSVRQRMIYLQQADPFSLLIATGQVSSLADTVVKLKGVVLDSVIEERRLARKSGGPEALALVEKLAGLKKQLTELYVGKRGGAEGLKKEIEAAESRLASLTASKITSREALSATMKQVQDLLAPDDAVLEFVRHRSMTRPGHWEPAYGALVIRSGQPISWHTLGKAVDIDATVNGLLEQMKVAAVAKNDPGVETDLKVLYDKLVKPLEPSLAGTKRLVIAPDGNLGRLSFAVLLSPDGSFLSERWELSYISTARDLLKPAGEEPTDAGDLLLLADPDYDESPGKAGPTTKSRGTSIAFDRSQLPALAPLPGTKREMEFLAALFSGIGGKVTALSGNAAREEALAKLTPSPRYLHLATHAFVLEPPHVVKTASQRGSNSGIFQEAAIASAMPIGPVSPAVADDPLQRAVLALAGANTTFAHWKAGEVPQASTDGVLSAAEVATLDLSNTWLAVLSACETAAGDVLSGEGVMGMRRGFFLAGVDHLVMTFWPIADEETVQVMTDFYMAMGNKVHPATALHRVQRDALVKWRKEHGLLKAVFLAGPFALSTTGKLPPL